MNIYLKTKAIYVFCDFFFFFFLELQMRYVNLCYFALEEGFMGYLMFSFFFFFIFLYLSFWFMLHLNLCQFSITRLIPAMIASYSSLLLEARKSKRIACYIISPVRA